MSFQQSISTIRSTIKSYSFNHVWNAKYFSIGAGVNIIKDDLIQIKLENELEQFPLVWLRDNCTCSKCFHKTTKSRIINWSEFNINTTIEDVKVM